MAELSTAVVLGVGRKTNNTWNYVTAPRALFTQTVNIKDPAAIEDETIIDLTKNSDGSVADRGLRDLTVLALLYSGTMDADAKIGLWIEANWDDRITQSSSSADEQSERIPSVSEITGTEGWALLDLKGPVITGASYGQANRSIAAVFNNIPAARYKVAVYTGITGSTKVLLIEKHTE